MEQWKDIDKYPNYQVSTIGRVKRKKGVDSRGYMWQERILKLTPDRNGYLGVFLSEGGTEKRFQVHRLVATAFIPNPRNVNIVNHLDCNPQNNDVANLEWCTLAENTAHAVKMGSFSKLSTRKPVVQLSLSGDYIAQYASIHEAARNTGLTCGNISSACRRNMTAGGFKWMYKTRFIEFKGEAHD